MALRDSMSESAGPVPAIWRAVHPLSARRPPASGSPQLTGIFRVPRPQQLSDRRGHGSSASWSLMRAGSSVEDSRRRDWGTAPVNQAGPAERACGT